jgi:hypothetical protein
MVSSFLPFRFAFTFVMMEDKDVFDLSHAQLILDVRRTRGVGQVQRPHNLCHNGFLGVWLGGGDLKLQNP